MAAPKVRPIPRKKSWNSVFRTYGRTAYNLAAENPAIAAGGAFVFAIVFVISPIVYLTYWIPFLSWLCELCRQKSKTFFDCVSNTKVWHSFSDMYQNFWVNISQLSLRWTLCLRLFVDWSLWPSRMSCCSILKLACFPRAQIETMTSCHTKCSLVREAFWKMYLIWNCLQISRPLALLWNS